MSNERCSADTSADLKPVAWRYRTAEGDDWWNYSDASWKPEGFIVEPLYAAPQPADSASVNIPFERLPQHAGDPGFGPVPNVIPLGSDDLNHPSNQPADSAPAVLVEWCRENPVAAADNIRMLQAECAAAPQPADSAIYNAMHFAIWSVSGPINDAEEEHIEQQIKAAYKEYMEKLAMPRLAQAPAVTNEMIDAGAQALADDDWRPPGKLSALGRVATARYRRQARTVLEAAHVLPQTPAVD